MASDKRRNAVMMVTTFPMMVAQNVLLTICGSAKIALERSKANAILFAEMDA
jgi:hypothetical protein